MDVLTLSFGIAFGLLGDAPATSCDWSAVWPKLNAGRYRALPSGAALVEPPRKMQIAKPASDVKRKVKGDWKVDLVIDAKGAVRDVRVAERPKMEPEWPEYEAHVLATVRSWKHGPAMVDGQAWPHCMTVTIKD